MSAALCAPTASRLGRTELPGPAAKPSGMHTGDASRGQFERLEKLPRLNPHLPLRAHRPTQSPMLETMQQAWRWLQSHCTSCKNRLLHMQPQPPRRLPLQRAAITTTTTTSIYRGWYEFALQQPCPLDGSRGGQAERTIDAQLLHMSLPPHTQLASPSPLLLHDRA